MENKIEQPTDLFNLSEAVEKAETRLKEMQKEISKLEDKKRGLETSSCEYNKLLSDYEKKVSELNIREAQLQDQMNNKYRDYDKKVSELNIREAQLQESLRQVDELTKNKALLESQCRDLRNAINQFDKKAERKNIKSLSRKLNDMTKQYDSDQKKIGKQQALMKTNEDKLRDLSVKLEDIYEKTDNLKHFRSSRSNKQRLIGFFCGLPLGVLIMLIFFFI